MSNGKVLTLDNLKLDSCSQEEDLATLLGDETSDLKAQNPETKVPAHVDCQWR